MNPSPALMPDYISPSAFWWFIVAASGIYLIVMGVKSWRRIGKRLDEDIPRLLDDNRVCEMELCDQVATTRIDLPRGGCFLTCDAHISVARRWIG
jgi:hypothetical protein